MVVPTVDTQGLELEVILGPVVILSVTALEPTRRTCLTWSCQALKKCLLCVFKGIKTPRKSVASSRSFHKINNAIWQAWQTAHMFFFWVDITSIWIWNFNILDAGKSFSAVSNEARGRFHRGVGGSKALTKLVIQLLFSESNRKPEKFWRKRFLRLRYLALQNVLQFPLPRPWVNVVMSIFFGKKHPKCLELDACVVLIPGGMLQNPLILLRKNGTTSWNSPTFL